MRAISFLGTIHSNKKKRCVMRRLALCVAMIALVGVGRIEGAFQYTLTDLAEIGATECVATAINSFGQVVGEAYGGPLEDFAFLYENGIWTDLGQPAGTQGAQASDNNDLGQVVGRAFYDFSFDEYQAVLWDHGTIVELGMLPGGTWSSAWGINRSGQIVGGSEISNGDHHAFLYEDGTMADLGTLGGSKSVAVDINISGQVVGRAEISGGTDHAFLYEDGTMTDLGALTDFKDSIGNGINDLGQVVGYSRQSSDYQAFVYEDGMVTDLGEFPESFLTIPREINNLGEIVGTALLSGASAPACPFLYSDGAMIDLNDLPIIGPEMTLVLHDHGAGRARARTDQEQL